jgi:hypothetical protein
MTADRSGGKAIGWRCVACQQKETTGVMRRIGRAASKATRLSKSKSPWCVRCGKRVEQSAITPDPRRAGITVVAYECHGETARQEMPASLLTGGLASYMAFNAYTSGLMLGVSAGPSSTKKGGKK